MNPMAGLAQLADVQGCGFGVMHAGRPPVGLGHSGVWSGECLALSLAGRRPVGHAQWAGRPSTAGITSCAVQHGLGCVLPCLQTATTAAAAVFDEDYMEPEESQATFGVGMPMPPMGLSKGELTEVLRDKPALTAAALLGAS